MAKKRTAKGRAPPPKKLKADPEAIKKPVIDSSDLASSRYDECWRTVITKRYLHLSDMLTLLNTDQRIKTIIETILKKSSLPVVITENCILRYPFPDNKEMYNIFGKKVQDLTLKGIRDTVDTELIFSVFRNINHLRLNNYLLTENNCKGYPVKITSLDIVHCTVHPEFMKKWFESLRPSLKHVFIKKSTYDCESAVKPNCCLFLEELPDIESLAMMQMHTQESFGSFNLSPKTLIIRDFDKKKKYSVSFNTKNITHLTEPSDLRIVEHCANVQTLTWTVAHKENHRDLTETKSAANITSLTMPSLPRPLKWLKRFKKLEHLNILEPMQEYEEDSLKWALRELKFTIPHIHYTKAVVPRFNAIFKLNEDCMRMVLSYLNTEEIFAIASHKRFQQVIRNIALDQIAIDQVLLKKYPLKGYKEAYQAIGNKCSKLTIACIMEQPFHSILSWCPNLKEVNIKYMPLKTLKDINKIPPVTKISLDKSVSKSYMKSLFQHLSPSLKSVECEGVTFNALCKLKNLRELKVDGILFFSEPGKFWKQNQSLEMVWVNSEDEVSEFVEYEETECYHKNWKDLVALPNLKTLKCMGVYDEDLELPKLPAGVKELWFSCCNKVFEQKMLDLAGPQLETLTLSHVAWPFVPQIRPFKNLRKLKVKDYGYQRTRPVDGFLDVEVLKALPKLDHFVDEDLKWSLDFEEKLRDYLRSEKRTLQINDVILQ